MRDGQSVLRYAKEEYRIHFVYTEEEKIKVLRKREVEQAFKNFLFAQRRSRGGNVVTVLNITPDVIRKRNKLLSYDLEAAHVIAESIINDKTFYLYSSRRSRFSMSLNDFREGEIEFYLANCSDRAKHLIVELLQDAIQTGKIKNDNALQMANWTIEKIGFFIEQYGKYNNPYWIIS